jgi:predicted alpha/beta hydrolase
MAMHDITSSIKYVQQTSGQEKLMYVGHSQGTTEAFVLLSDESTAKWANSVITHYVALAPICFMTNFKQKMILTLSKHKELVAKIAKKVHMYKFQKTNCKYSSFKKTHWDV